jgi:hypothetical protein
MRSSMRCTLYDGGTAKVIHIFSLTAADIFETYHKESLRLSFINHCSNEILL